MNNQERHEARYQRRVKSRAEKKKKKLEQYDNYDIITNRDVLSKAAHKAMCGVRYKTSVKQFEIYELLNICKLSNKLEHGSNMCQGFTCFQVNERGKVRDIMSIHFPERVVQKALNTNILIPTFTHSLIYDNCAGQKGKGTSFAMDRLSAQLRRHYHNHGNHGYALKVDFSNYFGNLDHELAKQMVDERFTDKRIVSLTGQFIDSYYNHAVKKAEKSGLDVDSVERKGLGLGSEVNQILAIAYLDKLDHYIKEVLRIKCYERYMDDLVLVHTDKKYLWECLEKIKQKCDELKITINERKTQIFKLSHGFPFLKTQFILTDTGKVIQKPCRDAITRTRRAMKKHHRMVQEGIITYDDARTSYLSRRASLASKTARRTIHNLDKLFYELYKDDITRR